MSVTVERIPDEPIIVLRYQGFMDVATVVEAFTKSGVLAANIEGTVFRIADVREADSTFVEVMNIIKASRSTAGSTTDNKFRVIFVGDNQLIRFYMQIVQNLGAPPLHIFHTLEDALEYIKLERAKQPTSAN
ncbi:MAG: hypothetical protein R3E39_14835 [Anaerolineae bacterium]